MKVKLARVEKGMTQEEVCKVAKVARATLIKVERGDYSPLNYNKMLALAEVLGKKPQELFFEE